MVLLESTPGASRKAASSPKRTGKHKIHNEISLQPAIYMREQLSNK
jgi:hypothetical protein